MTVGYQDFAAQLKVTPDGLYEAHRPSAIVPCETFPRRRGIYRNGFKRVLDVALVLVGSIFAAPLIAVLALFVKRDGGQAFYCQRRVGRDGRVFLMWKLRSMVVDADERLAAFLKANPAASREWAETQKLKCDPRITSFGAFLRRTSLDELPQIWNVLRGDMSLVGPRPMMVEQTALYSGTAYFAVRPGITGYWQTSGRNKTSFEARAGFDAAYERDLSLGTDSGVLLRTVRVVLSCNGY